MVPPMKGISERGRHEREKKQSGNTSDLRDGVTLCEELRKIEPISSQIGGQICDDAFYLRKYNVQGKKKRKTWDYLDCVRMSFQHFRLGDLSLHGPIQQSLHTVPHHPQLPQHHHQQPISPHAGQSQFPVQVDNPITTFSVSLKKQSNPQPPQAPELTQNTKQPYGSGDADDGYTLVFDNMDKFNEWRLSEEERTMCEFVKVCPRNHYHSCIIRSEHPIKGDTHGSKAVPPRFKDHTKLVCARHSRSGRKKYIKKHPERVRKVPSRKVGLSCARKRTACSYLLPSVRSGLPSFNQLQNLF